MRRNTIMATTVSVATADPVRDDERALTEYSDWDGLFSFLAAGAVLFASLVIGSSASLVLASGNDLIAAILEGFVELGLWAFGGFLAAVVVAVRVSRRRA
jgi:hypothetical protein